MNDKTIATTIAIGFFVFWFGVLLAGADFPPPIGFLWIILLDVAAACLVYIRVPAYFGWLEQHKRGRLLRALLDGLAIGLVFAFVTMLLPSGGEPSLPPPGLFDRVVWFAVVGVVGAVNAVAVYCIVYVVEKYHSQ